MHVDRAIARLATAQCGLVTHAQLVAAGLGRGAIAHRLAVDRLHSVHRGVYLVGHPLLLPEARVAAAVLACGEKAVLSHGSAADLWRMRPSTREGRGAFEDVVEVTDVGSRRRHRPGIRVHGVRALDSRDVRRHLGIATTAPVRTLLDLADQVTTHELRRMLEEALVQRIVSGDDLLDRLSHRSGRRGTSVLRKLLEEQVEPSFTRSEAERRLLELLRAAELPPGESNARLLGYEVDVLWRRQRLVVEVDGYAFHSTRAAFERDHRRDAALQAAGYRVVRVTWRQIVDQPVALVARLAQALASPTG